MLSRPPHDRDVDSGPQAHDLSPGSGIVGVLATLLPWLVLVALFSLVPELPRVPGVAPGLASITGHILVYGVLASIIYLLHTRIWPGPGRRPVDSAVIAVGVAALAGLALEWSQQLFTSDRAFQAEDIAANAVGAVTFSALLLYAETSGFGLKLLLPTVFAIGVALITFAAASYLIWNPALAYEDDHWHAPYRVVICGETQPFFPLSQGALHTRGDGVIHIQPGNTGVVGEKANLAAFFSASGGVLTNSSITLPSGERFVNGDVCPDGSAGVVSTSQFRLDTNSRFDTMTEPADYLPRDSQLILIEFSALP